MKKINAQEAFYLKKEEDIALIDVRTGGEFRSESVENSHHIALTEIEKGHFSSEEQLSKGQKILLLCQSGIRAKKAGEILEKKYAVEALIVEGGLHAWKTEGLPVQSSTCSCISIERQVRIGAGVLVALGGILTIALNPNFVYLPIFVGAGLVFAGITNTCGMAILLARMTWNR